MRRSTRYRPARRGGGGRGPSRVGGPPVEYRAVQEAQQRAQSRGKGEGLDLEP